METRRQAEELARAESQARQETEALNREMERQVMGLQNRNTELVTEVERLTHLLLQKPKVSRPCGYLSINLPILRK